MIHADHIVQVLVPVYLQGALPDGATVDADGCLWIAICGAGEVRRYSSEGVLLRTIEVMIDTQHEAPLRLSRGLHPRPQVLRSWKMGNSLPSYLRILRQSVRARLEIISGRCTSNRCRISNIIARQDEWMDTGTVICEIICYSSGWTVGYIGVYPR